MIPWWPDFTFFVIGEMLAGALIGFVIGRLAQ